MEKARSGPTGGSIFNRSASFSQSLGNELIDQWPSSWPTDIYNVIDEDLSQSHVSMLKLSEEEVNDPCGVYSNLGLSYARRGSVGAFIEDDEDLYAELEGGDGKQHQEAVISGMQYEEAAKPSSHVRCWSTSAISMANADTYEAPQDLAVATYSNDVLSVHHITRGILSFGTPV